jgi:hypothetical protein
MVAANVYEVDTNMSHCPCIDALILYMDRNSAGIVIDYVHQGWSQDHAIAAIGAWKETQPARYGCVLLFEAGFIDVLVKRTKKLGQAFFVVTSWLTGDIVVPLGAGKHPFVDLFGPAWRRRALRQARKVTERDLFADEVKHFHWSFDEAQRRADAMFEPLVNWQDAHRA